MNPAYPDAGTLYGTQLTEAEKDALAEVICGKEPGPDRILIFIQKAASWVETKKAEHDRKRKAME